MKIFHKILDKWQPKIPKYEFVYLKKTLMETCVNNPVYKYIVWKDYTLFQKLRYILRNKYNNLCLI